MTTKGPPHAPAHKLETAVNDVLQQDPDARRALDEGPDHGRGDEAHALQNLLTARNALLDAAARWDQAIGD